MTTSPAIKICGIASPAALDAVIAARADHAGLVFFPPSPRNVTLADAAALGARASGRIGRVGLFVDADDALLGEAIAAASLDAIQLHGKEPPERAAELRARFGIPVWKALSIASADDVAKAAAYAGEDAEQTLAVHRVLWPLLQASAQAAKPPAPPAGT